MQVRDRLADLYELRRRVNAEIGELEARLERASHLPQPVPPVVQQQAPRPVVEASPREIRQWARDAGLRVADRARVPSWAIERYEHAHGVIVKRG